MKVVKLIFYSSFQLLVAGAFAQKPSPGGIFSQLFKANDSTQTMFYQVQSSVIDGSNGRDSAVRSTASVWARRVDSDPVFGYFFHIQTNSKAEAADYYYNGKEEIYIRHSSTNPDMEKTISISMPERTASEMKEARALDAVVNLLPVLAQKEYTKQQKAHLDSMRVYETEKSWTLQWEETDLKKELLAQYQLVFDKKTYSVTEMHQRSLWRGVPFRMDFVVKTIRFNEPFEEEINWREKYPDYRIEYSGRKN